MTSSFKALFVRALVASSAALMVAGCPTPIENPPPEIPAGPRILAFSASPTQLSEAGDVELKWQTENATAVEIIHSELGSLSGVDNQASGSVSQRVESQSLFVLKARNARGVTVSAALAIEFVSGVQEVQFFLSQSEVEAGESAVLAWAAPGARTVSLTANGVPVDLLGQRSSGSLTVTPESATEYVFTADDQTRTATLTVLPKLISFQGPSDVAPGGTLTLSWATAGATQVTLESGHAAPVVITEPGRVREGSHSEVVPEDVNPNTVFSYVLRVTTASGELTESRKVYITGTPRIDSFGVPAQSRIGETLTLTWTTAQASQVEVLSGQTVLYRSPSATQAAAGSLELSTPTVPTTYTLVATGARGGEDRLTGTTDPVGAPTGTLTASTNTLAQGGAPVTLTWTASSTRKLRLRTENGLHVAVIDGENTGGSVEVYPNETSNTYVLDLDNGLGETFSASQTVSVTAPIAIATNIAPPIVENTPLELRYPGYDTGARLHGYPHDEITYRAASANVVQFSDEDPTLPFSASADNADETFTPEGFETFLWGERYEGPFTVSSNGYLLPGTSSATDSSEESLWPSTSDPAGAIAPFFTDLQFNATSKVQWKVVGTAPARVLVVQWSNVEIDDTTGTSLTFQAQVSQTGVVRFVYRDMNLGVSSTFDSYAVGTQNGSRTEARRFGAFSGGMPSGSEVLIFGPKGHPLATTAVPGGPFTGFVEKDGGFVRMTFTVPGLLKTDSIAFTELMYRPSVLGAEYLELFNKNAFDLDLAGFTIGNGTETHVIDAANGKTVISAGGTLVLGKSADPAENDGLGSLIEYVYDSAFSLPDTGSTLTLSKSLPLSEGSYTENVTPVGSALVFDPGDFRLEGGPSSHQKLSCPATDSFGSQQPPQTGKPGVAQSCFGYVKSTIPGRFRALSSIVTPTSLFTGFSTSFATQALTGGATFPFFGTEWSTARATAYGYIVLSNDSLSSATSMATSRPSSSTPNGTIAPFADYWEFNGDADSNVYYAWVGENVDPTTPDPHWVFEWRKLKRRFNSAGDLATFQLMLFKDGSFEYHYGELVSGSSSTDYAHGASGVVWVEHPNGAYALTHSVDEAVLESQTAIRFEPR